MVAIFTREQGVVRGVARHAMKSRRRFGGALEPMTHVQAVWAERPRQDVVRLDRFEILWSPLRDPVDYARAAGLAVEPPEQPPALGAVEQEPEPDPHVTGDLGEPAACVGELLG